MSNTTTLTVGNGLQYQTLASAILAANQIGSGVKIEVLAGTYIDDGGTITASNVVVESIGGVAKFVGASPGAGGKAAIAVTGANVLLTGLDISGVTGLDGVAVLSSSLSLQLDYIHLHDNQTGLVGTGIGQVSILSSVFDDNGSATGGASIDVGTIAALVINGTSIHDPLGGSQVKSSAQRTTISSSTIGDFAGTSAHALELPKGGNVSIGSSLIERGPNATASSIIAYGTASNLYAGSQVTMTNSEIVNDRYPNAASLFDAPVNFSSPVGNQTWNLPTIGGGVSPAGLTAALSRPQGVDTSGFFDYVHPSITRITGRSDGGVTLAGNAMDSGVTLTISETVGGKTALLGTVTADSNGLWSLTSHVKIDPTTLHTYAASEEDPNGAAFNTPGALFLTDPGADHLISTATSANVFSIMSFHGLDVIDGFKPASTAPTHDVLNFSGRGVSSFVQVQAMMSGSSSTVLTMTGGKTVTLTGVAPGTLSASDFVYS